MLCLTLQPLNARESLIAHGDTLRRSRSSREIDYRSRALPRPRDVARPTRRRDTRRRNENEDARKREWERERKSEREKLTCWVVVGCTVETTTLLSLLLVTSPVTMDVVVVSLLAACFTLRPPTIVEGRVSVIGWKRCYSQVRFMIRDNKFGLDTAATRRGYKNGKAKNVDN